MVERKCFILAAEYYPGGLNWLQSKVVSNKNRHFWQNEVLFSGNICLNFLAWLDSAFSISFKKGTSFRDVDKNFNIFGYSYSYSMMSTLKWPSLLDFIHRSLQSHDEAWWYKSLTYHIFLKRSWNSKSHKWTANFYLNNY